MKILMLCYEYPPLGGGGGRAAKSISEELVKLGHEVRFQTAGMPHLLAKETVGGVDIRRIRSFRKYEDRCSVPEMGMFILGSFIPTLNHIRTWRPDVIHAHFAVPTGALAYAVSLLTGIPYVITAHLGDVPGGVPEQTDRLFRYLNPFIKPIWKRAAAVTAVSEFVCELAEAAYGVRPEQIPNGIRIDPDARLSPAPNDPIRILAVGRLNRQKRFPFMIDVIAMLSGLPWKLDILGEGEERSAIESLIIEYGLGEKVRLLGWLDADSVKHHMRNGDILFMPSSFEGLSVAALEAMASGLAILGSDIGGLRDLVENGVNGYLVPVEEKEQFAMCLEGMINNPTLLQSMKAASFSRARRFDIRAIAEAYECVLKDSAIRRA